MTNNSTFVTSLNILNILCVTLYTIFCFSMEDNYWVGLIFHLFLWKIWFSILQLTVKFLITIKDNDVIKNVWLVTALPIFVRFELFFITSFAIPWYIICNNFQSHFFQYWKLNFLTTIFSFSPLFTFTTIFCFLKKSQYLSMYTSIWNGSFTQMYLKLLYNYSTLRKDTGRNICRYL